MTVTVLVATAGGHLAELLRLRPRLPDGGARSVWITDDNDHGRSLLAGEEVLYVPDCPSRDIGAVVRNAVLVHPFLRRLKPDWVISNGASLALSALPQAAAMGARASYIENSVRVVGPSLSGRLLAHVPGVETFTQYSAWASSRWRLTGSALDGWERTVHHSPPAINRVVVTVGTTSWQFRRLFEQLAQVIPPSAEVLWQSGATPIEDLGLRGVRSLPARELEQAMADAQLVIAHAGIGSAMAAFDAGRYPILVPRRARYGEAVDDHQADIARELAARALCHVCEVDEVTEETLAAAAAYGVGPVAAPPLLALPMPPIRAPRRLRPSDFS